MKRKLIKRNKKQMSRKFKELSVFKLCGWKLYYHDGYVQPVCVNFD